ncbi:MAG TPA: hypothetical protein VMS79_04040 [Methanomassiliicoccales archaeon]|jgi:hypothetical protein|nr:hypothetical protein [Methanomassiliicoccales archaeon]
MAERLSGSRTVVKCDVKGCGNDAERSVSGEAAREAGLDVEEDLRRVHLCKDHYKQFKKATKEERKLESLGR